ncbi:hypothetical protein BKA70DRAFT_1418167 [Coprinopsis sp. MPI-PUGE-AT-0042]|nr:hypothetical protein BKA70DRAFT_1418167 [Coprinopsis sp. MPI-PUGE-AT-0042]
MSRPSGGGPSRTNGVPSSVRGQLDPYDPKAPEGWRTIQLTETPGELKVLLPPGTAAMYEQLLKLESYEITKKTSAPSERLLEIRHLKERMIRKCQHLTKLPEGSPKRASRVMFQTVVAEADFRMKSMEKFFRDEQRRLAVKAQASRKPEPPKQPATSKQLAIANPPLVIRSTTNPPPKEKPRTSSKPQISAPERSVSLPAASAAVETINSPPPRITSPLPLPILLLSQREEYGLDLPPEPASEKPTPLLPFPDDAEGPSAQDGDGASGKQLQRRPSCIRRRSSLSDLAKRVSWADSQALDQQLAQYAISMKSPQNPGAWAEVRSLYVEHVKGLERLHVQVQEGLEDLQAESEHLTRINDTIRRQRDALQKTFQDFEGNYVLFHDKVQEALSEATESVARPSNSSNRPALPPIYEH